MPFDDYQYDVFISYKRDDLFQKWISTVVKHLGYWLAQELGVREVKIFVDQECLEVGDLWPESLKSALKSSRCMVGIWSPSYFQSEWCMTEWESFLGREKLVNMGFHGLIAPVRFHDGEHFPPRAKQVQWLDFAPYTCPLDVFWSTPLAVEFTSKIQELAKSVAAIIRRAPAYQHDWPIVQGTPLPPPAVGMRRL